MQEKKFIQDTEVQHIKLLDAVDAVNVMQVYCTVLCCSALQCVACLSLILCVLVGGSLSYLLQRVAVGCSGLQWVAAGCSQVNILNRCVLVGEDLSYPHCCNALQQFLTLFA